MASAVSILEDKIAVMPEQYVDEVIQFIDFLQFKAGQTAQEDNGGVYRKPGRMKGPVIMSDDFNEPLNDFKGYM